MKRIAFISTDWNDNEYRRLNNKYGGVSYYRLVKPMELLKTKYDVTFYGSDINKRIKGKSTDQFYNRLTRMHDMIIVKQIDNATASQALIHWCGVNKCILVQDYDDNMLQVREDQPAYKMGYNPGGTRFAYAAATMSLADALIVSTKPIKDYFSNFISKNFSEDKDIYIFPNYNDINDWKRKEINEKESDILVIGWAGSVTHDADLRIIMPALGKILDEYPDVYLELLGGIMQGSLPYLTQSFSEFAKSKVRVIFGTPAWDKYPELMMQQAWDIGLAPLIDDTFNQSKSHIKWMEYSMMGIPTIASDVYPYTNNIPAGTGILAKPDEWKEKISDLIEEPELRKQIAKNAYTYIEENLQWKDHAEEYMQIVDDIFEKHSKA